MATKGFKDPFADIRAEQEKREQELHAKKLSLSKKTTSMGEFRLLDEESRKMEIPEYHPPESFLGTIKRTVLGTAMPFTGDFIAPVYESPISETTLKMNSPLSGSSFGGRGQQMPLRPEEKEFFLAPSTLKRTILGAGGSGFAEGGEELIRKVTSAEKLENNADFMVRNNEIGKQIEDAAARGDRKRVNELMQLYTPTYQPQYNPEVKQSYEEKMGLKGTKAEDRWRGIGHETPAIIASYGAVGTASKIPAIGKYLTSGGKLLETGRRGLAAGAVYTPLVEENPELSDYVTNMALFGLGDVAFTKAFQGLGKIGKEVVSDVISDVKGFKANRGNVGKPITTTETPNSVSVYDFADEVATETPKPDRLALPAKEVRPDYAPWVREDLIKGLKNNQSNVVKDFYSQGKGQSPFEGMYETPDFANMPEYVPPYTLEGNLGASMANRAKPLSEYPFTDVLGEINPKVTEAATPPLESEKALVNYIHEYFGGNLSKNEIRKHNYDELREVAEIIAQERKGSLWETTKLEGDKLGYDVDTRYRLETDPEYRADWERLRDVSGLSDQDVRFKRGRETFTSQEAVNDFIDNALTSPRTKFKKLFIRPVGEEEAIVLKDILGKDVSDFVHEISNDDLIHAMKGHSDEIIESSRGQIAITPDDLKKIPEIISNYDAIKSGSVSPLGRRSIIYEKQINGNIMYVEVVHEGKKTLRGKTMWKEPSRHLVTKNVPQYTSEIEPSLNPSNSSLSPDASKGNVGQGEKFKRNISSEIDFDLELLQEAMTKRIGPFRIGKVDLAPEALKRADFKAANDIAEKLGLRLVPFKGTGHRGMQTGRTIYLNKDMKDPLDYVFWHEVGHSMGKTHIEHYDRLMDISLEHIKDASKLQRHYEMFNYSQGDIPHEFAADVFAEALSTPGFFARVSEKAPELIKPLLEAIESLMANIRGMISKDDTILPYLKDLEALRNRIREEVAEPYFKDAMGEKQFIDTFGGRWEEGAAKAKSDSSSDIRFKLGASGNSPIDELKNMIEYGASQLHKGSYEHFGNLLKKQFPDAFEGYSPEITERLLATIWADSRKLRDTGKVQFEKGGQVITVVKGETSSQLTTNKGAKNTAIDDGQSNNFDTKKHIASKAQGEPIIAREIANKFYVNAVDNLYRIDELDKFVAKTVGKHLPTEDKAYLLAINSRESTGAAKAILEENLVDSKGNIIGSSFKEVLSNLPRGKEHEFRDYLILRNAISWMEQGKQVYPEKWSMTPEKAMQRLAAYDKEIPELKKVADEYVEWHRNMSEAWLVDTGIISPEMWQSFINTHPYYVPFQRQMKPIEVSGGQGRAKGGFANQTNPTKKAEGSERQIIDPIESTIEQVERYIKTAKRNEVMQSIVRNLEKAPDDLADFAEVIPEKGLDALDNINAIFEKDGVEGIINYLEEPFEQMMARKAKANQALDKANIVRAFVNGERVHVKVNDPILLDALTALSDTGRNAIVESFRTVTRIMKVLTTGSNPIFAARNIARDVPMAYVASDTLSNVPVVREAQFVWGMLDAFARIVTNEKWHPDKFYREYKALGGGSHTSSVSADRNILAESKSKVMPGYWRRENNNPLSYAAKGAKLGFQGIERFTSTVEALPRLPEYIRTVKKGGNDYASRLEGLHASQDITVNFSRRGNLVRDADAFIPYFNAAVQGIDKIFRMFGKDPIGATYRSIVGVTVPTMYLYCKNKDNPNYHKLSNHIRDNYYCIPIQNGEKFIKIAKPREIGVVFSNLVERALRTWEADDPEGFYQFGESWLNNFLPPMRPIFAPLYDVLANKNFAGIPIVPGYMEGLSPELQYDDKTSAAAKKLGESLKLSPKQIDYLFRSFTGVIGELGIPAMAEGRGQNAGQRVGEVLNRTFIADPLYSNDVMTKFYEEKDKMDKAASDYKLTGQKSEYYNPSEQRFYNRQSQRISNIRKEIRRVNADTTLSFNEKEKRTRRMQANMLEIAQKAVGDRFAPRSGMAR